MIRRSSSKANLSLVNTAQEEHLTVSGGVVTNAPVTNLQAVKNSLNFEMDDDGAYILRKPIILKESFNVPDTYYAYDRKTKIYSDYEGSTLYTYFDGPDISTIKVKFYNVNQQECWGTFSNLKVTFISKILNCYNAPDHTLLSIKLDYSNWYYYAYMVVPEGTNKTLIHNHTKSNNPYSEYPDLYRLLKIYRDVDDNSTLIIELVNTEPNTITASEDSTLDVNMLLDNPYAIMDLYKFGYFSATKILAYVPVNLADSDIKTCTVANLTENIISPLNGKGFKILVSANNGADTGLSTVVLKAFITTDTTNGIYYCCWERSLDGVVWETCPEFTNKFSAEEHPDVSFLQTTTLKVSDLTSSEFEKMFNEAEGNLETVGRYVVEKQVVELRGAGTDDTNPDYYASTSRLQHRPDVLEIPYSNLKYKYRFQIYLKYQNNNRPYYSDPNDTTEAFLVSTTGTYYLPYSESAVFVEDLAKEREAIFNGKILFDEDTASYKFFTKNRIYYTDPNSFILKVLNTLEFNHPITSVINYRRYMLVFTTHSIHLIYNSDGVNYGMKTISNNLGLPEADAQTPLVILNSIYFKSGTQIYKLTPNLYASSDDILNIQIVSLNINNLVNDLVTRNTETSNFAYSDSVTYRVFIPFNNSETYCLIYYIAKKIWTIQKYPIALHNSNILAMDEAYVQSNKAIYHFKDNVEDLLESIRIQDLTNIGAKASDDTVYLNIGVSYTNQYFENIKAQLAYGNSTYTTINADLVYSKIPYCDFQEKTVMQLYEWANNEATSIIADNLVDYSDLEISPIEFKIDFGQKSSNYALDKQFLESKFIFATLHPKDMFPVDLDISTDGYQKPLHYDCNTDSPFWKNAYNEIGSLNTNFGDDSSDYDGILRQLIVKYSGKGKTIRHIISGTSKYRFKFISLDTRYRIIPNKQ